jgi:hypothetical protein
VRRQLAVAVALVAGLALAAPAAGTSLATLRLKLRVDTSRGAYVEGAFNYASLRGRDVSIVRRFSGTRLVFRAPAGRYVLRSYARPCDGTCSRLDPPMDACRTRLTLRAGAMARVRVVAPPGSPCRLRALG